MSDSIAREFARWSVGLTFDDLPAPVVDKVKAVLLQGLIASVYGAEMPPMRDMVRLTIAEEGKPDGATVLVAGEQATRVGAAYANTELMYAAGLYDYYQALTHPGPILVSTALANGELEGSDLREIITALAAGYEVTCRLADQFVPSTFARGFRPASVFPTVGAATVAAKLMDLDEDRTLAAIALAANSASGLAEAGRSGGTENAGHLPHATRSGVFAAVMARTGRVRGSEQVIEGDAGFYNAFVGNHLGQLRYSHDGRTRVDMHSIVEDLGAAYRLLEVTFHMYPLHGASQPVIDLLTEMRQRHAFEAEDIERVTVRVSYLDTVYPSPAFPRATVWPPGAGTIHYYAAHVAVHGGYPQIGGAPSTPHGGHAAPDAAALEFAQTRVSVVGEYGRPMFSPEVEVRMTDGTTHVDEYPYARMFWGFDDLVARLEGSAAAYPLGRPAFDALVDAVRHAERLESPDALFRLVARE
ncbi:MAG: MmgE/PrpD family protein [Dehalococcoidia bacterium]